MDTVRARLVATENGAAYIDPASIDAIEVADEEKGTLHLRGGQELRLAFGAEANERAGTLLRRLNELSESLDSGAAEERPEGGTHGPSSSA